MLCDSQFRSSTSGYLLRSSGTDAILLCFRGSFLGLVCLSPLTTALLELVRTGIVAGLTSDVLGGLGLVVTLAVSVAMSSCNLVGRLSGSADSCAPAVVPLGLYDDLAVSFDGGLSVRCVNVLPKPRGSRSRLPLGSSTPLRCNLAVLFIGKAVVVASQSPLPVTSLGRGEGCRHGLWEDTVCRSWVYTISIYIYTTQSITEQASQ